MSRTQNPNSQQPEADENKSKEEDNKEPKDPNQQANKSETSTNDKLEEGYYVVQIRKKRNVEKETEGPSSTKVVTDCYMVKSCAKEENEELRSFSYLVQWDCYSQQEAGCLPFKKDYDLYVGKKEYTYTQEQISNVIDKHKVYYMKKMKTTDIQQKGITSIIEDNANKIYHTRGKKGKDSKTKVHDVQSSFLLKVPTEEITAHQRENISRSLKTNQNQICVYQSVEMECTDPERRGILSRITDIRRSVLDIIMGDGIANFIVIFTILIILMMIAAAIGIVWSKGKEKDDDKSCEIDETLLSLNINFSVPCKYHNVKNCLENSLRYSMASLSFDASWLIFGLILMILPERQKRTCLAVYVCGILLSGSIFGSLFLKTRDEVVDLKTQQENNYEKIKTFMIGSLEQHYTSDVITNNDTMSDKWNKFFIKYDCCAVNQVASTTNDFDTTPWCTTSGSCQQTNSQIPKTCCKDVTEDDYMNAANSCHATVNFGTYKDSCFAQVKKFDDETMSENDLDVLYAILGTIGILKVAFQVASVVSLVVFGVIRIICVKKRCI